MSGFTEIRFEYDPRNGMYGRCDELSMDDERCNGCQMPVGPVLEEDDNGHDKGRWIDVWEDAEHNLFCEDCVVDIEAEQALVEKIATEGWER